MSSKEKTKRSSADRRRRVPVVSVAVAVLLLLVSGRQVAVRLGGFAPDAGAQDRQPAPVASAGMPSESASSVHARPDPATPADSAGSVAASDVQESTSVVPTAEGEGGSGAGLDSSWTWAALLLAGVAAGLGSWAWLHVVALTRRLGELESRARNPVGSPPPPARAREAELTAEQVIHRPSEEAGEVRALRERIARVERELLDLRDHRLHGEASTARSGRVPRQPHPGEPAPPAFSASAGDGPNVIGGALGQDGEVRQSAASKPMVEIRWTPGRATAEVWINPEFKFAEVTAGYLGYAFDVDGGGPGSYETTIPATIDWALGATGGRVRARGRARALGA